MVNGIYPAGTYLSNPAFIPAGSSGGSTIQSPSSSNPVLPGLKRAYGEVRAESAETHKISDVKGNHLADMHTRFTNIVADIPNFKAEFETLFEKDGASGNYKLKDPSDTNKKLAAELIRKVLDRAHMKHVFDGFASDLADSVNYFKDETAPGFDKDTHFAGHEAKYNAAAKLFIENADSLKGHADKVVEVLNEFKGKDEELDAKALKDKFGDDAYKVFKNVVDNLPPDAPNLKELKAIISAIDALNPKNGKDKNIAELSGINKVLLWGVLPLTLLGLIWSIISNNGKQQQYKQQLSLMANQFQQAFQAVAGAIGTQQQQINNLQKQTVQFGQGVQQNVDQIIKMLTVITNSPVASVSHSAMHSRRSSMNAAPSTMYAPPAAQATTPSGSQQADQGNGDDDTLDSLIANNQNQAQQIQGIAGNMAKGMLQQPAPTAAATPAPTQPGGYYPGYGIAPYMPQQQSQQPPNAQVLSGPGFPGMGQQIFRLGSAKVARS